MQPIKLTPAAGGWLHADWGDGKAWVRFARDSRDRLTRIVELHVADPTPAKLRRVPLNRIHAAATMRGAGLVQLLLATGIDQEPPPGMLSGPPAEAIALERRYKLKWKRRQPVDDDFLRDVAHAYESAQASGLNPRKAIVDDTGAADATVAGWVLKARRKGYLPRTTPGKVSMAVMVTARTRGTVTPGPGSSDG
jgi:hypothetical protein